MEDDDYGAAQPIMDVLRGGYKKANDIYRTITGSGGIANDATAPTEQKQNQVDPEDVRKATATFATKPQQIPTQTKAQKRPIVAAKMQVKTSVKPGPQKQAGGK